ncbi:glycosyltransferase family 4 protein [Deltaproteobacteria bacterium TL4]
MKKVLLYVDNPILKADGIVPFLGGIERHCAGLLQTIQDFEMVAVYPGETWLPSKSFLFDKKIIFAGDVKKVLNHHQPDLVHVHGFSSISAMIFFKEAHRSGYPIIYSPYYHPFENHRRPWMAKLFYERFTKNIICHARHFICLNPIATNFLLQTLPIHEDQLSVIPPWCSLENIAEVSKRDDLKRVLFVGRMVHNKGLNLLENHLPPDYQLTIAAPEAKPFQRENTLIKLRLSDDELRQEYRNASIVVVPSSFESFSLVALEALTSGVPVVISDRVSIQHYIQGEALEVFPYSQPEMFTQALKKLTQALERDELAVRKNAQALSTYFSKERSIQQTTQVYENVLKNID